MSDLISRQAAIDVLSYGKEILYRVLDDTDVVGVDREKYSWGLGLIESHIKDIEELPSAQPTQSNTSNALKSLDCIDRQAAIDAMEQAKERYFDRVVIIGKMQDIVSNLPSAQPEWNNHTVACLLAELFDDTCACNYNDIDEWLPEKCELLDSCPHPGGVACWEQFLKHKAKRRSNG